MLILLTGLPGVGKSTVARMLAEKTNGTILNSDALRKELFPRERTYSSKETGVVIQETRCRTRAALAAGKTVILDALFTKQDARDEYRALARELGVDFLAVFVTTKEDLIKERLEARPHTNDPSEATFEYYLDRKKWFEPVKGEYITIDNSAGLEELQGKVNALI